MKNLKIVALTLALFLGGVSHAQNIIDPFLAQGYFDESEQIYVKMTDGQRQELLKQVDYETLFKMINKVSDLDKEELKSVYYQHLTRENYFQVSKAGPLANQAFLAFQDNFNKGITREAVRFYYVAMYLRAKYVAELRFQLENSLAVASQFLDAADVSAYDSIAIRIDQSIKDLQVIVNCDTYCMVNGDLKTRSDGVRIEVNENYLITSEVVLPLQALLGINIGFIKNPADNPYHVEPYLGVNPFYEGAQYLEVLQRPTDQGLLYALEVDYFISKRIGVGLSLGGFRVKYDFYPFQVDDISENDTPVMKFATFPNIQMLGKSWSGRLTWLINKTSYRHFFVRIGTGITEVSTQSKFEDQEHYSWLYKQLNHPTEKSTIIQLASGVHTIQKNQKVYFATEVFYDYQFSPNTMMTDHCYGLKFSTGLVFLD